MILSFCLFNLNLVQESNRNERPQGVRVNAVNPATVATQLHMRAGMTEEKCRQYWQSSSHAHPLGHFSFLFLFPTLSRIQTSLHFTI